MPTLNELKGSLATIYRDLTDAERKIKAGTITTAESEQADKLAHEAEDLQRQVDEMEAKAEKIGRLAAKGRETPEAALPAMPGVRRPGEQAEVKAGVPVGADGSEVVGYLPIGEAFINSPEFKSYVAAGMPAGQISAPVQFKGIREPHVEVTRRMLETKAIPSIGTGFIRTDRVGIVAQAARPARLQLRDVINVSQTQSSQVEYTTENAIPEDAAPVAEAGTKPETTATLGVATAPVRTLAVWQPVTEQMLQDVPNIANLLNNRMLYQLGRLEEKQMMYGSGSGQNLQGILTLGGVPSITRTVTDTTNLDRIRIGITDVLVAEYEPNAVLIHPVDWEAIVLLKATDDKYIWTVVTDAQTGRSRVWGLDVVETTAMKNPASTQRFMLVGDFRMGATLWDRQQAAAQVGWINDQFITNQRTLRVEERLAFGVHAPLAFAKYETAVAA